jgi:hypothetical protein
VYLGCLSLSIYIVSFHLQESHQTQSIWLAQPTLPPSPREAPRKPLKTKHYQELATSSASSQPTLSSFTTATPLLIKLARANDQQSIKQTSCWFYSNNKVPFFLSFLS